MLRRQLCKVFGHKWAPIVHTKVGGYAKRWCRREQKWIEVSGGFARLTRGSGDDA